MWKFVFQEEPSLIVMQSLSHGVAAEMRGFKTSEFCNKEKKSFYVSGERLTLFSCCCLI
jgi:hypothetical protein